MYFVKLSFLIIFLVNIFGCTEKTTYSGKILTEDDLSNLKIQNKEELFQKFGKPSYFDNFQNKYFYYTEKNNIKNFYIQKTEYSYLFVFKLNDANKVVEAEAINLLDNDLKRFKSIKTPNNIIERGLIEKIFGGVGPNQLPNSQ